MLAKYKIEGKDEKYSNKGSCLTYLDIKFDKLEFNKIFILY